MMTKTEWQAVNQAMMAEDRRRLGEPPTSEEMLAYARGELSAEEEARVRERLVAYPELVRTLTAPFPSVGAEPGDPDYMPDGELAAHWASLQKRMSRGRVVQFWPALSAIAATLALVFGALLWQARVELREPRVTAWNEQLLLPDNQRGGGEPVTTLRPGGDAYVLVPALIDQRSFDGYRVEILDAAANPPRSLWSMSGLRRRADDTFVIRIPRAFLGAGKYQVVLYGVNGAREERLASYTVRVQPAVVR